MNDILKHILRFFIFVLIQSLVLNQIELGWGVQIMIYPLYILLLPIEWNVFALMIVAFFTGLSIDIMSNTFGLHASALVTLATLRPVIFAAFSPRDGYDNLLETNIFNMGYLWFFKAFGSLLFIHHLWFFTLEIFKLNEILFVLQKSLLSFIISIIICVLFQFILINKQRQG